MLSTDISDRSNSPIIGNNYRKGRLKQNNQIMNNKNISLTKKDHFTEKKNLKQHQFDIANKENIIIGKDFKSENILSLKAQDQNLSEMTSPCFKRKLKPHTVNSRKNQISVLKENDFISNISKFNSISESKKLYSESNSIRRSERLKPNFKSNSINDSQILNNNRKNSINNCERSLSSTSLLPGNTVITNFVKDSSPGVSHLFVPQNKNNTKGTDLDSGASGISSISITNKSLTSCKKKSELNHTKNTNKNKTEEQNTKNKVMKERKSKRSSIKLESSLSNNNKRNASANKSTNKRGLVKIQKCTSHNQSNGNKDLLAVTTLEESSKQLKNIQEKCASSSQKEVNSDSRQNKCKNSQNLTLCGEYFT